MLTPKFYHKDLIIDASAIWFQRWDKADAKQKSSPKCWWILQHNFLLIVEMWNNNSATLNCSATILSMCLRYPKLCNIHASHDTNYGGCEIFTSGFTVHPFPVTFLGLGCSGSRLGKVFHTIFFLATSSSFFWGIPRPSQARWNVISPECPVVSSQLDMWNTSTGVQVGAIRIRCLNHLKWLLSMRKSRGSTLSYFWLLISVT